MRGEESVDKQLDAKLPFFTYIFLISSLDSTRLGLE